MDNTQRCIDAVWTAVREEAAEIAAREPLLARLIDEVILSRRDLFESLSVRLSRKLGRNAIGEGDLYTIFMDAFSDDEATRRNIVYDIAAIKSRDPACTAFINPILYYKGFMSISSYRVAHWLWGRGRKSAAYYMQSICSEIFAMRRHLWRGKRALLRTMCRFCTRSLLAGLANRPATATQKSSRAC